MAGAAPPALLAASAWAAALPDGSNPHRPARQEAAERSAPGGPGAGCRGGDGGGRSDARRGEEAGGEEEGGWCGCCCFCCCSVRGSGCSTVPPDGSGTRRSRVAPAARPHPSARFGSWEGGCRGGGRRGEGGAGEAPLGRPRCAGLLPRRRAAPWRPNGADRGRPGAELGENCSCSRSPSSTQSYVIEVWMRKIAQAERGNCSSTAALPLRPGSPRAAPPPPREAGLPRSRSPARPLPGSCLRFVQPPRPAL